MQKSNTIAELTKALILFHVKVDAIKKDSLNPFFKSSYASLPNILEAINDPLNESGLTITTFPVEDHGLYCLLMHESGEWIEGTYYMKPEKDTPQGRGSCISYQRRYCISSILNLQIDDILHDDDGNKATYPDDKPSDDRKWLNQKTKEFDNAKQKYKSGLITMLDIKKHYKISKETELALQS